MPPSGPLSLLAAKGSVQIAEGIFWSSVAYMGPEWEDLDPHQKKVLIEGYGISLGHGILGHLEQCRQEKRRSG
jgi:hypothetical protein